MPSKHTDLQPLGLTVHSTPSMHSLAQGVQDHATQRTGRWKMFAVLLVCAAPVIASYFTYYVVRPEGRRNFGALIAPQKTCLRHSWPRRWRGKLCPCLH